MGKQDIVDRIISDANSEAEAICAAAEKTVTEIITEAERRAESEMLATRKAVDERVRSLKEGRAASARLDGAKIMLAAKRRVIDGIYAKAAERLFAMSVKDCLLLTEKLLVAYAEEGDEILLAEKYPCAAEVAKLKVVAQRSLKLVAGGAEIDGGFILRGKYADKDLSYSALLAADRAEHEAEIAAEIFK